MSQKSFFQLAVYTHDDIFAGDERSAHAQTTEPKRMSIAKLIQQVDQPPSFLYFTP